MGVDIDVSAVVRAADEAKRQIDRSLGELKRCRRELIAAQEDLDKRRRQLDVGHETLRKERCVSLVWESHCLLRVGVSLIKRESER